MQFQCSFLSSKGWRQLASNCFYGFWGNLDFTSKVTFPLYNNFWSVRKWPKKVSFSIFMVKKNCVNVSNIWIFAPKMGPKNQFFWPWRNERNFNNDIAAKMRDFLVIVKQCACCARPQTLGEKQQEIDFHCWCYPCSEWNGRANEMEFSTTVAKNTKKESGSSHWHVPLAFFIPSPASKKSQEGSKVFIK